MKVILINSLLYFLFVSASAEKERLSLGQGGSVDESRQQGGTSENNIDHSASDAIDNIIDNRGHFETPSEMDHGNYDENIGNGRNIIKGRTEETPSCVEGDGSIHHQPPCDENVVSKGINSSDSISTRNDPITQAPRDDSTTEAIEAIKSSSLCVSSDGTFGNISDTALMTVPITYLYEMEVVVGTNVSTIDDKILPRLEKAILDSILQEVFPDKCASTAIGKRKRKLRIQRRLEVIRVSMYPPDYITANSCNILASSNSTSNCVVVSGELTMFIEEEQVVQEQPRINNLIKENMNSGVYDNVSEEIIHLHYLESSSNPTESNNDDGSNGIGGAGGKTQNSLRVGLFVGLGALAAILAGVVFRTSQRMGNSDDQTNMQSGAVQTYLDVDAQQSHSVS